MSEKLKKQSVIISLIWAFVGTIGVVYYIKIGTGMDVSPNYANNIIYYFRECETFSVNNVLEGLLW